MMCFKSYRHHPRYCSEILFCIPQISSLHSQIRSQESDIRSQEDELGRSKMELGQLQEEEAQLEQSLLSGRVQLDSIIKSLNTTQDEINQVRLHRSSRVSDYISVKLTKLDVQSQMKLKSKHVYSNSAIKTWCFIIFNVIKIVFIFESSLLFS